MNKKKSLLSVLIIKTLPIVALFVVFISVFASYQSQQVLQKALVEEHSIFIHDFENHIDYRISSTLEQIKIIAKSGLTINGLVDTEHRDAYVPIFFQSVSFANVGFASVAYMDYKGRVITSNTDDLTFLEEDVIWKDVTLTKGLDYVRLTSNGFFISVPVYYGGSPEGAVTVFIHKDQFATLFKFETYDLQGAVIGSDGEVLYSTDSDTVPMLAPFNALDSDWFQQSRNSNIWPEITSRFYSFQHVSSALQLQHLFGNGLLIAAGFIFLGFLSSVVLASRNAVGMLKRLETTINEILSSKQLSNRVDVGNSPKEISDLGYRFNQMVSDLQQTTFSKERVNSILNSMQEYLVVTGKDGELYQMNSTCRSLLEETGIAVLSDYTKLFASSNVLNPFDAKLNDESFTTHFNIGRDKTIQRVVVWRRTPLLSESGDEVGYIFLGSDITNLREQEASLRILNHAIEEASNGISIADARLEDLPLIYVNQSFEKMTGYSKTDVLGSNCRFLQGEDSEQEALEEIRRAIKNQESYRGVLRNYRKNGELFWCELAITPVFNESGELTHFLGVQDDVTSRIEQERLLSEAKENAELASRAKGDFLSTMSHEIRTPMNGVLGMADLLSKTELTVKQRDFVHTILDSGKSLINIINDILDFSKIESGKLELESISYELEPVAHDVMYLFSSQAQDKSLQLILDLNPNIPRYLMGDSGRLRQVLLNLVGNAVKFTEAGFIRLKIDYEEGDRTLLNFEIEDTGVGIPESKLASLFNPFTQADSSTTRTYGGSGLGLSISKSLVEAMGGRISVSSVMGQGSTFAFSLPIRLTDSAWDVFKLADLNQHKVVLIQSEQESDALVSRRINDLGADLNVISQPDLAEFVKRNKYSGIEEVCFIWNVHSAVSVVSDLVSTLQTAGDKFKLLALTNPYDHNAQETLEQEVNAICLDKPWSNRSLSDALWRLVHRTEEEVAGLKEKSEPAIVSGVSQFPNLVGRRVLLVDDTPVNLIVAKSLLEIAKVNVDTAENGKEAVEMQESGNYDAILMDCLMPVMDGYEATQRIREDSDVPIIALTANAMDSAREKCLDVGMNDFITKPIEAEMLYKVLDSNLTEKNAGE